MNIPTKIFPLSLAVSLALATPAALAGQGHSHVDHHAPGSPGAQADLDVRVRPDGWVHGKVRSALARSRLVRSNAIDVDVDNGVVLLTGTVDTLAQAQEAVNLAHAIEGVVRVDSHLVVRDGLDDGMVDPGDTDDDITLERPDAWVLAKVKAALLASDIVGGLDIDVDVDEGTVWLRGDVRSSAEANEAVRIAESIQGVAVVVSELTLGD